MNKVRTLIATLFGRRWWWITLAVIAIMAVLARLGFWQLDRLAERRAANAQLQAALASGVIDLNQQLADYSGMEPAAFPSDLANRDVVMTGAYDFDNQMVLKLQNLYGIAGVHLITPFIPNGQDAAVLVDRGWIPDTEYEAGHVFDEDNSLQTVEGYIALTETIRRRTAESTVPVIAQNELYRVDIAAIEDELPYSLAPFYVKAPLVEGSPDNLPVGTLKEVDLSEGPHLSYAMQWFIFCIGLGTGYVIYVNRWLSRQDREGQTPEPVRQN
jgi:surfeit locus 1 family protein